MNKSDEAEAVSINLNCSEAIFCQYLYSSRNFSPACNLDSGKFEEYKYMYIHIFHSLFIKYLMTCHFLY